MLIEIIPYQDRWPGEFQTLGNQIRKLLGDLALRIDHIGSTSVPGLAAKDIIDIQLTVKGLHPEIISRLKAIGYFHREDITGDHLPPGVSGNDSDWQKWLFKSCTGRPVNLHVRIEGKPNQRYPILFRDYLRSHPYAAEAYARVKLALVKYHPDDMDAYYDIKDPVCDIIMDGAEDWAQTNGWNMGKSDC